MKIFLLAFSLFAAVSLLHSCCKFFAKSAKKQDSTVQQAPKHVKQPELHTFIQEATNKQVAEADLKTEVKDVVETAAALAIDIAVEKVVKK